MLVLTRGVRLSRSTEAWGVQNEPLSLLSLQVAAKALETGVFGAYFNVLINLKDMTDDVFKEKVGRHDARLHPGTFHVYCGQD